ncbi:magnesium transporter [Clostridiales bacterium COT073_COT-073]|nr:magnesium transporter [Clostridiales bacterium COT073_COT-073]
MENLRLDDVRQMIEKHQKAELRKLLLESNPVDVAELMDELTDKDLLLAFRILPKDLAADVFSRVDSDTQQKIIESISEAEVGRIINELFVDDAVDFIEEMPAVVVKKILKNTSPEMRKEINLLLSYPDDSAGTIMTTEFADLQVGLTVRDAIKRIRKIGIDSETINVLYVIDENRHLLGMLEIRKIILASPEDVIGDIMDTNVISVHTLSDQEEVASLFKKYDLLAMPVVDREDRLVGIVTVDDILDVIEEENEEDFAKMSALEPSDDLYLETNVFVLAKRRIVWLLILMVSATFTGLIIRKYEDVLSSIVILTAFIPMLMDTGGNAGSQSSTLIIRGLALGELELKDFLKIMYKELLISLIVGSILALINFVRLYYIEKTPLNITLTVTLSMIFVVMIAKVSGGLLPVIAKKLHLDPAIMAGPFITTIVDTLALIVYFKFAQVLILK